MNSLQFFNFIKTAIGNIDFANHNSEPDRIFEHILGISFNKSILTNILIIESHKKQVFNIIEKRKTGMPLSYIFGYEYFYGYKFIVDDSTLIPRHDSEILVSEAIKLCKSGDKVLDLCCGSGCLGLAIAKNIDIDLTLFDLNKNALKIAEKNAKLLDIKANIVCGDVFEISLDIIENADIIISNPPYISQQKYDNLEKQVIQFEPKMALTDNFDGLSFYKSILKSCNLATKKPRFLLFEIDSNQANDVPGIKVIKDLAGRDRVIVVDFYI